VKESPCLPRRENYDLRLTPLVVQSSDSRRTAAPPLPHAPDIPPARTDGTRTAVPAKDDIVGWPEGMPIEPPKFPDPILDS